LAKNTGIAAEGVDTVNPIKAEWTSPDGQHRILLGDCLEILPTLDTSEVAAVLADPPYGLGIGKKGSVGSNTTTKEKHGFREYGNQNWDIIPPTSESIQTVSRIGKSAVVWGGNYFTLPPASCWLIWDKGQRDFSFADGELAWTNLDRAVRIFTFPRSRLVAESGSHPTQKPVALMIWCLSFLPPGLILDPYAGSCTVAVACERTGRSSISIEIERKYFDIGVARMERELVRHPLLDPPPPRQRELIP